MWIKSGRKRSSTSLIRGMCRKKAGSRRRSFSRAKERKPRGSSRVQTLPSSTKACGRFPARTQRKGRLRRRAKASKWRLVWATPFTSWNESGKYATRGTGAAILRVEPAESVQATEVSLLAPLTRSNPLLLVRIRVRPGRGATGSSRSRPYAIRRPRVPYP